MRWRSRSRPEGGGVESLPGLNTVLISCGCLEGSIVEGEGFVFVEDAFSHHLPCLVLLLLVAICSLSSSFPWLGLEVKIVCIGSHWASESAKPCLLCLQLCLTSSDLLLHVHSVRLKVSLFVTL